MKLFVQCLHIYTIIIKMKISEIVRLLFSVLNSRPPIFDVIYLETKTKYRINNNKKKIPPTFLNIYKYELE